MGGLKRCLAASGALALAACSFDSSGLVGSGSGADDEGTTSTSGSGSTLEPTTGVAETGDESLDVSTSLETTSTTTGDDDAVAVLELVDGPLHGDFGPVDLGGSNARAFLLSNTGNAPASNIQWSGVAHPFLFVGGVFPGVGGDCMPTLDAGSTCMLVLAFEPTDPGPAQGTLAIHYQDGATQQLTERELSGAGMGATDDLLVNGDAEACTHEGADPFGWTKANGTGWRCEAAPHLGGWSFYAGNEDGGGEFVLRQDVPVSPHAEVIDMGVLTFVLDGWARSSSNGDDPYRIDLFFLGEAQDELGTWSSGWQTNNTDWTQHSHAQAAPPGTRTLSVRLLCSKGSLGELCDAYFDDLTLHAVYPPP